MSLPTLRRFLIGEPLPTARAIHQRLSKVLALPVFGSDAISSSAYATEEILLALLLAGTAGLAASVWVALAIAALFVMVSVSYRQTVKAYPSGGGAYIVARENLGTVPGLTAAAALLTDYVLTVAVSVAAGVAAIISALPELAPYRVLLGVLAVGILLIANLRATRESGTLFAPPVYLFVGSVLLLLAVGGYRIATGQGAAVAATVAPQAATQGLTLLLLLRAFASGCAALTGIEAISNGVPAFRPPESRNAASTLLWMVAICLTLFIGITVLAQAFHIVPDTSGRETVLSLLGRAALGQGFWYLLLQAATAAVLVLAANTAFADFPRLSSLLARDGFAPRQLANLGDRLVFANGIVLLGLLSSLLLVAFGGLTHHLIPLYAVGVFVSFTLSQAGMVVHWARERGRGWRTKAAVNALGALATAVVLVVVASVKFVHGAWMVLLFVPLLMLLFTRISRHYRGLDKALALTPEEGAVPRGLRHVALVLVPGVHRGIVPALAYARAISTEAEAVSVEIDPASTPRLRAEWAKLDTDMPLTVLKSPWRSLTEPVIRYTRTLRAEKHVELVTVIIPEFVVTHWWHGLLHNQSGLLLKLALLFEPGVVVANVRYRPRG